MSIPSFKFSYCHIEGSNPFDRIDINDDSMHKPGQQQERILNKSRLTYEKAKPLGLRKQNVVDGGIQRNQDAQSKIAYTTTTKSTINRDYLASTDQTIAFETSLGQDFKDLFAK